MGKSHSVLIIPQQIQRIFLKFQLHKSVFHDEGIVLMAQQAGVQWELGDKHTLPLQTPVYHRGRLGGVLEPAGD